MANELKILKSRVSDNITISASTTYSLKEMYSFFDPIPDVGCAHHDDFFGSYNSTKIQDIHNGEEENAKSI